MTPGDQDDDEGDEDLPLPASEQITTGDVGDPVEVRRQLLKKAKNDQERELQTSIFWRMVLSSPAGRRIIWEMMNDEFHYNNVHFASTGQLGAPNHDATMFELGKQHAGMVIFNSLLKYDRDGVYLMLNEHDPRFRPDKRQTR